MAKALASPERTHWRGCPLFKLTGQLHPDSAPGVAGKPQAPIPVVIVLGAVVTLPPLCPTVLSVV